MNRKILLFVAICGLAATAFAGGRLLNMASAGFVDETNYNVAMSASATNVMLCKGKIKSKSNR